MITDWTRALVLFKDKRIGFEDKKKMRALEIAQTEQFESLGNVRFDCFTSLLKMKEI